MIDSTHHDPLRHVALAQVGKPHGVRGAVLVRLYNAESTLLDGLDAWILNMQGEFFVATIKHLSRNKKGYLVLFEGIDSREAAEELRGVEVFLPRSALPPTQEGEFYLCDLKGLSVVEEGTEQLIGVVKATIEYPTTDCVLVAGQEGRDIEIPLRAPWLSAVCLEEGVIRVSKVDQVYSVEGNSDED